MRLADVVEQDGPRPAGIAPITHAVVRDVGAVAAFHVSDRAWLLAFFPSVAPSFPSGAIALLGAVLAVLLGAFEVNRRRAEREADRAARALGEKQNLLNTMQVPLMVVDPNTDEVVSANRVAESIGIRRGARFAERISLDARARAHYERTQVATSEARRAYGVPIRVDTAAAAPPISSQSSAPSPSRRPSRRSRPTNAIASPSSFSSTPSRTCGCCSRTSRRRPTPTSGGGSPACSRTAWTRSRTSSVAASGSDRSQTQV